MDDWFELLAMNSEHSTSEFTDLIEIGFVVVPGPIPAAGLAKLAQAYDAAVAAADLVDVRIGSTTTRVSDFVNRGPAFDALYVHKPALDACCGVINQPFRLSTKHARTVRPHVPAQALHVDFARAPDGWPMVGFIFMVDEFRRDNGATRFVPGSHEWRDDPHDLEEQRANAHTDPTLACGPAGSMILFNGSVWHGHSANVSDEPRRSIQGAYIRREAPSGVDLVARMTSETLARIGPLARYLVASRRPAGGTS